MGCPARFRDCGASEQVKPVEPASIIGTASPLPFVNTGDLFAGLLMEHSFKPPISLLVSPATDGLVDFGG